MEEVERADGGGDADPHRAEQFVDVDRVGRTGHRAGERLDRTVAEHAGDLEVDAAGIFERGSAQVRVAQAGQVPVARPAAHRRERGAEEAGALQRVVAPDIGRSRHRRCRCR